MDGSNYRMPDKRYSSFVSMKLIGASLFAVIELLLESAPAFSQEEKQHAIEAYNHHQYQSAANILAAYCRKEPADASAHYYLANAYLALHKNIDARTEYKTCLRLSPYSPYGFYSEQAVASLKRVGCIDDDYTLSQNERDNTVPRMGEWYKQPESSYRSKWDKWDEPYVRRELNRQFNPADSTIMVPFGTNRFVRNYQPTSRLFDHEPPIAPVLAHEDIMRDPKGDTQHGESAAAAHSSKQKAHADIDKSRTKTQLSGKLMPNSTVLNSNSSWQK